MEKFLIGYKQGNGAYVYVDSVNSYNIGVTLDINNALEFADETMAKNVSEFLNYKDTQRVYLPVIVTVNVKEIVEDTEPTEDGPVQDNETIEEDEEIEPIEDEEMGEKLTIDDIIEEVAE